MSRRSDSKSQIGISGTAKKSLTSRSAAWMLICAQMAPRFRVRRFCQSAASKKILRPGNGRRLTRHCSLSYTSHQISRSTDSMRKSQSGASNPNNVEIFIRRHGRINSWIAASAVPRHDARHPSPFSDLFEIHSGIYLPTGYDVDLLSAEYSRALCASRYFLVVRFISCPTFDRGQAHGDCRGSNYYYRQAA